ncbi:MAG: hypothetical protein CFH37_01535 [Alphaproteobacteria bacterium MarineAlpha9_Bin7]|nr:MAG: hypothetical protein CFH37_01535 [Alphaproteobacteria bacterium MarineAlpha9_Bin7]
MTRILAFPTIIALTIINLCIPHEVLANDPQKLIEDSAALAKSLLSDPKWSDYQSHFKRAKGVVLAPDVIKGGLIFGGSGGQCVIVARNEQTGEWSAPSFCAMGEATIGLQIGIEKLEVMLLIMNGRALKRVASGTVTLGGEAGISVGFVGSAIESGTTLNFDYDIVGFARSQGLYGGVTLEGGYIGPDWAYNHAYYGQRVTAQEILFENKVNRVQADVLRAALRVAQ